MNDVERLIEMFTDPSMTRESQASVLAYARGRLDAQREFRGQMPEAFAAKESCEDAVGGESAVA